MKDFEDREALMLLLQVLSGDQAFTRKLLKRFAPYQKELLGKSNFTKGWERIVLEGFVKPLCAENRYLKNRMGKDSIAWWGHGDRLAALRKLVTAMAYSPSDPLEGKHIDGLGIWFRASHFRHFCSDQANVYPLYERLRTDGGPVHFLSLWTIRDVKAGDELTWSRINAPFGIIPDSILRPMLVMESGKLCRCSICLQLEEILQTGVMRAAKKPMTIASKTKQAKQTKKRKTKKKKKRGRKQKGRINELVDFIEGKRDKNPLPKIKVEPTKTEEEVTPTLVIDAQGEMSLVEERSHGKETYPLISFDNAIESLKNMETALRIYSPHPKGLVRVVYSIFVTLTVHLAHASEHEQWNRVHMICAAIKRCLETSPLVVDLAMTCNPEAMHQVCLHYQRAFMRSSKVEDAWWWGAFYYRLMRGIGRDLGIMLTSLHNAIMFEFGILSENPEDEGASKRIACYYLTLQEHLTVVFGSAMSVRILEESFSLLLCSNAIINLNSFMMQKVIDYGGSRLNSENLRDFRVSEVSRDIPDPIYPHRVIRAIEKCDQVIAAARLQKAAHRFLKIRHGIIGIQSVTRGNIAREKFNRLRAEWNLERRSAAIRIQRAIRRHMPAYLRLKLAAITIQSVARMAKESRRFNRLRIAAKTVQGAVRKKRLVLRIQRLVLERRAATLIQSHIRTMNAKCRLQVMIRAATLIQSHLRSYRIRSTFVAKRKAIIKIQSVQRMRVTRRRTMRKIAMKKFLRSPPRPQPEPVQLQFPPMPPLINIHDPLYLMHVAGCIRLNNDAKAAGYPEPFPNPWAMPTPYKVSPYYYPCPFGLKP